MCWESYSNFERESGEPLSLFAPHAETAVGAAEAKTENRTTRSASSLEKPRAELSGALSPGGEARAGLREHTTSCTSPAQAFRVAFEMQQRPNTSVSFVLSLYL